MNIFLFAFLVAALIFSKRISDRVKVNPLQRAATSYFKSEKMLLKRYLVVTVAAFLLILFFRKTIVVVALAACLIYAIFIAFKQYKISRDIIGSDERYAVRLYTAGKLICVYTVLTAVAGWLC